MWEGRFWNRSAGEEKGWLANEEAEKVGEGRPEAEIPNWM